MTPEELAKAIADVKADTKLKDDQKERKIELLNLQQELDSENAKASGKGLRWFAGMTRGKSSQVIKWQAFDTDSPETLPSNPAEFADITGMNKNSVVMKFIIDGYNVKKYEDASDPANEFLDNAWPDELKNAFRISVKTMAKALEQSLEDTATQIRPGFDKKFAALQAS